MNILNIRLKSKTNANIFVAETDLGEYILHSDEIVRFGITKGEVDKDKFFEAVAKSEELIAFNLSTKYLSGKLKTEKQMKDYLYKKEFNFNVIEKVILKLKEYKFIDDEIYAETYKRSNPNFSVNKLKQKFMVAGVKSDISNQVLDSVDDFESCLNHANKFFKNKLIDKLNTEKLIRRLSTMGYRWDTIRSVLNELKAEIEE